MSQRQTTLAQEQWQSELGSNSFGIFFIQKLLNSEFAPGWTKFIFDSSYISNSLGLAVRTLAPQYIMNWTTILSYLQILAIDYII